MNLRLVGGIPLVGLATRTALAAAAAFDGWPHRVVCSTDDEATAASAAAWGAEILVRPVALAGDGAAPVDVALHALDTLERGFGPFRTLVLLRPTLLLADAADVVAAIEVHHATGGRGITTVSASHPAAWHHSLAPDGTLEGAHAVDSTDVLLTDGCHVVTPASLRRSKHFVEVGATLGHVVPAGRAIVVDEELDLAVAEAILAARPVRPVPLGSRSIGDGRVFVIAEAGVNHNGDVSLAKRLVDAAAAAGADAVKFQTFDPAALATAGAPTAAYQRRAGVEAADQREMLTGLALPAAAWAELQAHALAQGLVFLSTPFDDGSAELLDGLGVPAFKVGSGELTNTPFITRLARRGRPLLISTGMADMVEVAAAVDAVRAGGNVPIVLFHCVSSYPAAPEDANLRAIETMRRAFGVPVGWSDHTPGTELALAAVAAGASVVEKHLTVDCTLPGPDHRASLEPDQFATMVAGIRAIEVAMGTGIKRPVEAERDVAGVARRSLHWARSFPAGHPVTADDIAILRPGTGLAPARLAGLTGRRTARAVETGIAVRLDDLEGRT